MVRTMRATGLSLTPAQFDRIEKDRKKEDLTRSQFLRKMIKEYYRNRKKGGTAPTITRKSGGTEDSNSVLAAARQRESRPDRSSEDDQPINHSTRGMMPIK